MGYALNVPFVMSNVCSNTRTIPTALVEAYTSDNELIYCGRTLSLMCCYTACYKSSGHIVSSV